MNATDCVQGILKNIFQGKFLFSILLFLNFSIQVYAAEGDFLWAKSMGGSVNDEGNSIFVDSAGFVYTTGSFEGTVDFDPEGAGLNLVSEGDTGIFISKMDQQGSLVWAKVLGGNTFDDAGFDIFVDADDNVYVTGYFQDTVDFDPEGAGFNLISEGSTDIFIVKLDSKGNFIWARALGGTSSDYGYGIFTDSAGNVYTAGYFQGTLYFNQDDVGPAVQVATTTGVEDIFICKMDRSGNFLWSKTIGGPEADVGYGISLFSNGYIYTTGSYRGTVDFDPGAGPLTHNLTSNGLEDIFVSKLDTAGNFVWAKTIGGSESDIGHSIAVDSTGNVYTTGSFQGTVNFDPDGTGFNLTSDGPAADIFITRLDSNGNFVWAKGIGGPSSDIGYGISVNASGNVYTTGFFAGTVDFDPDGIGFSLTSNPGNPDIFISKLDRNGNFGWAKGMGGDVFPGESGRSVFADTSGNVYTTGYFRDTADFDPDGAGYNLTSNGAEDIFILKLAGRDASPFSWTMFLPAITGRKQSQQ